MGMKSFTMGLLIACCSLPLFGAAPATQPAGKYKSFKVCVYCPIGTINIQRLDATWEQISSQVKVDKVYIETYRSRRTIQEETIEPIKKFFMDKGVEVAGGMTLVSRDSGQFETFSYAKQEDRDLIKGITEMTSRHFDEIILDDFFFYNTKNDADIAAKGNKSWTQYRLDAMRDVAENYVVKPSHAVNPKMKMVVKFPNWYEHFQGLGFDLDQEPMIFDGIYSGTETRDPVTTEQHLQPYESYEIIRYFENIKPGGNGGGWVDTYQPGTVDRYAEQLWLTAFAKAREVTLFNWADIQRGYQPGNRPWANEDTSFNLSKMGGGAQATWARVAGYALEQADQVVYKTGKPIGLASYRPPQATGEDFLHNFIGMIGIPIELYPTFPAEANNILLTEAAKDDKDIVSKIKGQLKAGKNVVITSGLLKNLVGKGIEDISELYYTGGKIQVTGFHGQGGNPIANSTMEKPIIFPEITFKTNQVWYVLAGVANGNGFPILISDKYSNGTLYVLTIPDNYTDLYSMPPSALNLIRNTLTAGLPVRIDGPSRVSLFEYDNNTFIVQNFNDSAATLNVSAENAARLKNLQTDEVVNPGAAAGPGGRGMGMGMGGGARGGTPRANFNITLKPHSFMAFSVERN